MAVLLPVIVFCVVFFVMHKFYVALLQPDLAWVPGPFLCKFTGLVGMWEAYCRRHGRWLQALHEQYGEIVRIGPHQFSTIDPAMIPMIYEGKDAFPKSDKMKVMHNVAPDGRIVPSMISVNDKVQHANIRKPVTSLYSTSNIMTYEDCVNKTIGIFVRKLSEFVDSGETFDFSDWAQYWASDTIANVTMGKPHGFMETGSDVDGMLAQLRTLLRYRSIVVHAPWIDWLLVQNPIRRKFPRPPTLLMKRSRQLVIQRKKERNQFGKSKEVRTDFLSQLMDVHEQRPDQVPAPRLVAYVGVNLMAGTDTTAIHMRSIVYFTLKSANRNVMVRLQKELDDTGFEHPFTYQQALHLPYLTAVIHEAQRMFHISAGVLEREIPPGGLTLTNGKVLPAGCGIGVSGTTVQLNKDVYGQDAKVFNPDRWLQGKDEIDPAYAERLKAMKGADMSFGRGSRTCLGKNVAMLELYKTVATLFGLFDIELVDPEADWFIQESFLRIQHEINIKIAWRPGKNIESLADGITSMK